ncbi:MAG: hypothetical protein E6772_17920 [Dysgonomonas sp.]|nr:hypothetical protein [Dysgonomonas sp.]
MKTQENALSVVEMEELLEADMEELKGGRDINIGHNEKTCNCTSGAGA